MTLNTPSPPGLPDAPPFATAREARQWLELLPLINTQQSSLELRELFGQLNRMPLVPIEQLKTLEILREAVHITEEGLQKHFTGKPLPLSAPELQAWQEAQTLWESLETAYARCWQAARQNNPALSEHLALIAERLLRYGQRVAQGYLLVYRPVPAAVWQRLFACYRQAEEVGIHQQLVRDGLIDIHGTSSPQAMLIHALLLSAARPYLLTSKLQLWLDKRLEVLATRSLLAPRAQTLPGKAALQVDLLLPAPALRASRPLAGLMVREIDTLTLAQALSKRIRLLREGELPQKLGLGAELSPQAAESLLTEVYRRWCEHPTEPPLRPPVSPPSLRIALGLANIQRFICTEGFSPPPRDTRSLSARELETLSLFGYASSEPPASEPLVTATSECWPLWQRSAKELLFCRPANSTLRVGLQQLIGVESESGETRFGVVRSLEDREERLEVGVRLLHGLPQAIWTRATDLARLGKDQYHEALLVPASETPAIPASLITPPGLYRQNRLLDLWDGQAPSKVRLIQLLERGADHERISFTAAGT